MKTQVAAAFTMAALAALSLSCSMAPPEPLPPNTFAFGVFGDGPYRSWEVGRFKRVVQDANACDLAWFLHIGDIMWFPCSDAEYAKRFEYLNRIEHPLVYTPGDNEWSDCYQRMEGGYDPLDRLQRLRDVFFRRPHQSLGAHPIPLETQSDIPGYAEFVENALWTRGGFVFATIHVVGGGNGRGTFAGRTSAHDDEVARRTAADIAWINTAFDRAQRDSASGVFVAMHADPLAGEDDEGPGVDPDFAPIMDTLARRAADFGRPVMLIHGDNHEYHLDQPLMHPDTGEVLSNLWRLETFGSPQIGWVRVVVDSVQGRVVNVETRTTPDWWLF